MISPVAKSSVNKKHTHINGPYQISNRINYDMKQALAPSIVIVYIVFSYLEKHTQA